MEQVETGEGWTWMMMDYSGTVCGPWVDLSLPLVLPVVHQWQPLIIIKASPHLCRLSSLLLIVREHECRSTAQVRSNTRFPLWAA